MSDGIELISPFAGYLESFGFLGGSAGAPSELAHLFAILLAIALHLSCFVLPVAFALNYLDRKLGADIQMRIGPNKAGFYGVAQGFADFIKDFFKEELFARGQETVVHKAGVLFSLGLLVVLTAYIPIASAWVVAESLISVLIIIIALVCIKVFLFWSSNAVDSAWSKISSFRIFTSLGTYSVLLLLGIIPVVYVSGTLNIVEIVKGQGGLPWQWHFFHNPGSLIGGVVFLFSMLMWLSRMPFDYEHSSPDIQAGYVSGFSGIKSFYLKLIEYLSLYVVCALFVSIYLGGWQTSLQLTSFGRAVCLVELAFFMTKLFLVALFCIWIRWSLPRSTVEQMFNLSWDYLLPIGLTGTIVSLLWMGFIGKPIATLVFGGGS